MTAPATPALRSARPIFIVAALAFLPGLGVIFGLVACIWGLIADRPRAIIAAAIGAAGTLLNFAGCAAYGYWVLERQDQGSFARMLTATELVLLVEKVEEHRERYRSYPATLRDLGASHFGGNTVNIFDRAHGLTNLTVPYRYELMADRRHYRLSSVGPDRLPDTADDIYPVLSDSLAARSGLQPPPALEPERAD
jgi:hypothetical protein